MNKQERLQALMRQRGELPQEEEKREQPKKSTRQLGKPSNKQQRTSAGKRGASSSGHAAAKRPAAKPIKKQVKKTRTGPAAKSVSKRGMSLAAYKERQRRQQQKQALMRLGLYAGALLVLVFIIVFLVKSCKGPDGLTEVGKTGEQQTQLLEIQNPQEEQTKEEVQEPEGSTADTINVNATPAPSQSAMVDASAIIIPNWITQDFIRVNEFSRPQIPLNKVEHIAIHWVANPESSARGNREYFDGLGNPEDPNNYGKTKASAHFVVGLEGEIIQCMPLSEMAYAVRDKFNPKTISIEVCHWDWEGKFSDVTYNSVVKLSAWLMQQFGLEGEGAILRHHDCDGKDCPKYYVEHPDEWKKMQQDILNYKEWNPNIS